MMNIFLSILLFSFKYFTFTFTTVCAHKMTPIVPSNVLHLQNVCGSFRFYSYYANVVQCSYYLHYFTNDCDNDEQNVFAFMHPRMFLTNETKEGTPNS